MNLIEYNIVDEQLLELEEELIYLFDREIVNAYLQSKQMKLPDYQFNILREILIVDKIVLVFPNVKDTLTKFNVIL